MYAALETQDFAYAHNSYIVNLKHVAKVEGNLLVLMDGTALSISRSRKEEFYQKFARYLGKNTRKAALRVIVDKFIRFPEIQNNILQENKCPLQKNATLW